MHTFYQLKELKKNSLAKHDSSTHKATTCTYLKLEPQNWARKTMIAGKKRLSPNFQDTDVTVLAVILFQLAAVFRTKDVMKPLPLMFSFSNRAFLCEGCISTTETVFHCSGWHGTPAAHVLCWTPIQHKDFSSSHCYGVKDTERQTMIVMMFTKLQPFSFHESLSAFGHLPLLQAAVNHVMSRKPDVMTAQSRANNAEDKQWSLIFTDRCIIVFLKSHSNVDLTALFWCSLLFFFPREKQQVCVWADGRELADAPWGWNQLCRRPRSMFIFGLY